MTTSSRLPNSSEEQTFSTHQPRAQLPTHIVGIGASAGGLEALELLFSDIPVDSGMAFVVIQHLSPEFDSLMETILSRHTKIPIRVAEDRATVEANTIYLNRPRTLLTLSDGRFELVAANTQAEAYFPINTFFNSLAKSVGQRAIAIILSGTGADGALSLAAVNQAGGLVIVQSRHSAPFEGMPASAIATGFVDLILPPGRMAEKLLAHRHKSLRLAQESPLEPVSAEEMPALRSIFRRLNDQFRVNFDDYKSTTILRRIERRVQLKQLASLETYQHYLQSNPEELRALYDDLLINVTQFFRDPVVFDQLRKQIIPQLAENRAANGELQVWIAACASGEEAYSVAMLFDEYLEKIDKPLRVLINGTDIHGPSIECAVAGIYPSESVSLLPAELQQRYFQPVEGGFQVSQKLRDMMLFTQHDLIQDPPLTNLDLICCRNMLIYLKVPVQQRVLVNLTTGLKSGGCLLLGSSETTCSVADSFETVNRTWRIYRKLEEGKHSPSSLAPLSNMDQRPLPRPAKQDGPDKVLPTWVGDLLTQCMPSGLLLDQYYNILYTFGDADLYLQRPIVPASSNVLTMVGEELGAALQGALFRAKRNEQFVALPEIGVMVDEVPRHLAVSITPLSDKEQATIRYFVRMEEKGNLEGLFLPPMPDSDFIAQQPAKRLQYELELAQQSLLTTLQEFDITNEELHATNEELQSANEELSTTNEELYTVNTEFQRNIVELTRLNNDLANLQRSAQLSIVFLNLDLTIRDFSPAIGRLLGLNSQDKGRPLAQLPGHLTVAYATIEVAANHVLRGSEGIDLETQSRDDRNYLLRVLPYLTEESRIDGIILNFIDITERKANETALASSQALLQAVVDHLAEKIVRFRVDTDLITFANHAFCEYVGRSRDELIGYDIRLFRSPESSSRRLATLQRVLETRQPVITDGPDVVQALGAGLWVQWTDVPIFDDEGNVVEIQTVTLDITERKALERIELDRQTQQYFDVMTGLFFVLDTAGNLRRINPNGLALLGYTQEELLGRNWFDSVWPEEQRAWAKAQYQDLLQANRPPNLGETRLISKSGAEITILRQATILRDADGQVTGLLVSGNDITNRKAAELALVENQRFLEGIFAASPTSIYLYDLRTGNDVIRNQRSADDLGMTSAEMDALGQDFYAALMHPDDLSKLPARRDELQKSALGQVLTWEYRMRHKSGRWRWLLAQELVYERDAAGNIAQILGATIEITNLKETELALSETTRFLRTITDNLPAWFAYLDRDYRFQFASRYYETATGIPVESMIGNLAQNVLSPKGFAQSKPNYDRALAGETVYFEKWTEANIHDGNACVGLTFIPDRGDAEVKGFFVMGVDLTEIKRAEAAVEENQRFLTGVLQAMPAAIYIYDLVQEINVYSNDRLQQLTGYSLEEVQSLGDQFLMTIMHPEDFARQPAYQALLVSLPIGESRSQEYRMKHKDGSWRWILTTDVAYQYSPDGSLRQTLGAALDISVQKTLEAERQEQARFIQAITEADPNFIYVFSLNEQRNLYLNREMGPELGYTIEEVQTLGQEFLPTIMHPDDWATQTGHWQRLLECRDGEVIQREYRVLHKDGQWRWLLSYETIFNRNDDGSVAEILGTGIDITAQKETQQLLDESYRQLRIITDNLPARIGYIDKERRIQFANRAYSEQFGIPPETIVGQYIWDIVGKKRFTDNKEYVDIVLDGFSVSVEYHGEPDRQGGFEFEQLTFVPDIKNDEVVGYFAMIIDITPIKQAQEEIEHLNRVLIDANQSLNERVQERTVALEEANAELMRSNADLDSFVYIASHDLKEPLRGIQTYLDVLKEEHLDQLNSDGQALLNQLSGLTSRTQRLIDDLRIYARINQSAEENITVNLNETIDEIRIMLAPLIAETNSEIRQAQSLPTIDYNPSHILTIFQNLINNGIKYNDSSHKVIEIGMVKNVAGRPVDLPELEAEGVPTILYVRDNGIGIRERHHGRIFDMFKRLHPEHKYGGGTGAGLALVKKIIEQHGGKIWLESEEGKGTTFFVQL